MPRRLAACGHPSQGGRLVIAQGVKTTISPLARTPLYLSIVNMSPPHTPTNPKRREYDTPRRARFYQLYDQSKNRRSFNSICKEKGIQIPPSTGRFWLHQRAKLGSPAKRRTRKLSTRLGQPQRVSSSELQSLLDPKNPLHYQSYDVQAQDLPIKPKTLQQNLVKRTGAKRFRKPKVKAISAKNKRVRISYGINHRGKTIRSFWQYVYFTDEAHWSSKELSNKQEYELRAPGTESRLKNLQEVQKSDLNVTLHSSGGISYNFKGPLLFYKDPPEPSDPKPYQPHAPRRSSVETSEEHAEKVQRFKESQKEVSAGIDIIPKGNAMNQVFYTKHILPHHIKHIKWLEAKKKHKFWFQEDNDPSHGTRSTNNIAARAKRDAHILILLHPAQSPDLNPIESIWQIIKQRLRGGSWETVAEFKAAIQREWDHITQSQIRKRISEMRWRCEQLEKLQGKRIRSTLW
jgi:DDE superfamily endonuclease